MESTVTCEESVRGELLDQPKSRHWLIDLENVPTKWELILPLCCEKDIVTLFVSSHVGAMKLQPIAQASTRGVIFRFVNCVVGTPNAMDFQLVAELGRLSVLEPDREFVVVSGDNGFRATVKYMEDRGVVVSCLDPGEIQGPRVSAVDPVREVYRDQVSATDIPEEELSKVVDALCNAMLEQPNARKLNCLNRLRRQYGDKKGREYYSTIKTVVHSVATNGPFPEKPAAKPKSNPPAPAADDVKFRDEVNRCLAKAGISPKAGEVPKVAKAVTQARKAKNSIQSLQATIGAIYVDKAVRQRVITAVTSLL